MLRVAVVGSGPSGCYTAQHLVQLDPAVRVDVLDRLPCPYGLVRYGVAPDHEKIKSLQNGLRTVLEHERVRFLGAVPVGPDGVPAARLRELYHAVVFCVGAAADRRLGVPGEDLPGSWSATEFVSWYSAHPDAADAGFLRGVRSAVVVGVGNVAVDVTRMLARGTRELRPTDMPHAALTALAASEVTRIHMVGPAGAPPRRPASPPGAARTGHPAGHRRPGRRGRRGARPGVRRPVRPAPAPAPQRRGAARLDRAAPPGRPAPDPSAVLPPPGRTARPRRPGGRRALRTDGAGRLGRGHRDGPLRGHRGSAGAPLGRVPGSRRLGLPFDAATGTVPHLAGRVLREGAVAPGEYVAGWIKRGPTGVIGTNRSCAKETVTSLLEDAPSLTARALPADPPAGPCAPRASTRSSGRAGSPSNAPSPAWARPSAGAWSSSRTGRRCWPRHGRRATRSPGRSPVHGVRTQAGAGPRVRARPVRPGGGLP